MIVFHIYLSLVFSLHTIDEIWNCENPRKYPKKNYMVCNWEEEDIFKDKAGNYHPHPKVKEDNYFERKARIRYWRKKRQGKE